MAEKDLHRLHRLALKVQQDLLSRGERAAKKALRGAVPLGTRKTTPEERLQHYLSLGPAQKMLLQEKLGPDSYQSYEETQLNFLVEKLGPAASILMPYIAPNLTAGIEQAMTGNLPGAEGYNATPQEQE